MKRLSSEEIIEVAVALSMNEEDAKEVVGIFADIREKEQHGKRGWRIRLPLENVDEYIREWDNHWHRESDWTTFYAEEKENYYEDYDDADEIFKTVDTFKAYAQESGAAYELRSGMIVVVC